MREPSGRPAPRRRGPTRQPRRARRRTRPGREHPPPTSPVPPSTFTEFFMFVQLTKDFLGKKAGERLDVGESDASQLIAAGAAVAVTDDPITPLVSRALESALGGFTRGLDTAITETLKRYADAQSQARRHAAPALFGPGGGG